MFLSKRLKHLKSNTMKKQIFIPFFATNLQNLWIMCAILVTFQVPTINKFTIYFLLLRKVMILCSRIQRERGWWWRWMWGGLLSTSTRLTIDGTDNKTRLTLQRFPNLAKSKSWLALDPTIRKIYHWKFIWFMKEM